MSRDDWLVVFWFGVSVVGLGGLFLFGSLGYWWRDVQGIIFALGAWALFFGLALGAVALKMLWSRASDRRDL